MTRSTTKKTAAKKTADKKTADPLEAVREDTPNPELTDLDRENESCAYCGRDAVAVVKPASRFSRETPVCERHKARAEGRGQEVGKL